MKKRILTIAFVIIIMLIIGTTYTLAADIEMNVQGQTTINSTDDTVELILSLGNFTEVEEGQPLGYQGTITYDENVFEGITVEGLNRWTASYEDNTKVFMGEIDSATANTQIAKITLTLKEGLSSATTGTIQFNNILLTDGTNDFTFNREVIITVEEENSENNEENTEENTENTEDTINQENTNTIVNNNTTSIQANNTDTTVSNQILPSAGVKNVIIISIIAIIVLAIIFKIKSRKIKY